MSAKPKIFTFDDCARMVSEREETIAALRAKLAEAEKRIKGLESALEYELDRKPPKLCPDCGGPLGIMGFHPHEPRDFKKGGSCWKG